VGALPGLTGLWVMRRAERRDVRFIAEETESIYVWDALLVASLACVHPPVDSDSMLWRPLAAIGKRVLGWRRTTVGCDLSTIRRIGKGRRPART